VVMNTSIFSDIKSCSPLKDNRNKLAKLFLLPSSCWFYFLAYCSNLKVEAMHFSETPVDFQPTVRHCIPQDRIVMHFGWFPHSVRENVRIIRTPKRWYQSTRLYDVIAQARRP
jgi:hypothetical protein